MTPRAKPRTRGACVVDTALGKFAKSTETMANGRHLTQGMEVSIRGLSGRFRFLAEVTNTRSGETWVEVLGPLGVDPMFRGFPPTRIRTVHASAKFPKPTA